jgi:hypothetical protein
VEGLLSPVRFLTKICMVSSGSAEEARDETLEMLLERMFVLRSGGCEVVAVMLREWCSYPIRDKGVDGWSGDSGPSRCSGGGGVAKWQQLGVGGEEE